MLKYQEYIVIYLIVLQNLPYIKDHMTEIASEFSREYQVTCILKDARTIICVPYGQIYVNAYGNPGMATAGSGDVLSGIIAGCISQLETSEQAAALGVLIHSLAGDLAAGEKGVRSMLAGDIVDQVGRVLERRI